MLTLELLQTICFGSFVFTIFVYLILGGFDLGLGILYLFLKNHTEKHLLMRSIQPIVDKNTLWLLFAGGILYFGFPLIFHHLVSQLYLPIGILLFALFLRSGALYMHQRIENPKGGKFTETLFSSASLITSLTLGLFLATALSGFPLKLLDFFSPYKILITLLCPLIFMIQGLNYLSWKTEGQFQGKINGWMQKALFFFYLTNWVIVITTLIYHRHLAKIQLDHPLLLILIALGITSTGWIHSWKKKTRATFWGFCLTINLFLIGIFLTGILVQQQSIAIEKHSASFVKLLRLNLVILSMMLLGFFHIKFIKDFLAIKLNA